MTKLLSSRDYLQIQEAAEVLSVSQQTLRNWDRSGKLRAQRHPINGYRLYRASDLHALLRQLEERIEDGDEPRAGQLALELIGTPRTNGRKKDRDDLPPCHWSAEVALDPRHRPQRWDAPSSTVRRDWRKFPQEAHLLDSAGRAYRRLTVEEIAILQGFAPDVVDTDNLTDRQRIAALGDAVPPPLARAILTAVDGMWEWQSPTALEICAGVGGLAEGAASVGLEHAALLDTSSVCGDLLRRDRPWRSDAVRVCDVRAFDYAPFRSRVGLLSGGPPCQPWSQSGLRLGRDDDRDLLGHLDTLVGAIEPEVFVFENVPGLASPANEPYLRHVIDRLRRPGQGLEYGVLVGLLNAADFGVPQRRRRLFILGFRSRPSALAGRCLARIEQLETHVDPAEPRGNRAPWRTIGEAFAGRPDPGGWRRWIGSAQ